MEYPSLSAHDYHIKKAVRNLLRANPSIDDIRR